MSKLKTVLIFFLGFMFLYPIPYTLYPSYAQTISSEGQANINRQCAANGRLSQPNSSCVSRLTECERTYLNNPLSRATRSTEINSPAYNAMVNTLLSCRNEALRDTIDTQVPPLPAAVSNTCQGEANIPLCPTVLTCVQLNSCIASCPQNLPYQCYSVGQPNGTRACCNQPGSNPPATIPTSVEVGLPIAQQVNRLDVSFEARCRYPSGTGVRTTVRLKDAQGAELKTETGYSGRFIYISEELRIGDTFTVVADPIDGINPSPSSVSVTLNRGLTLEDIRFNYPTCPAATAPPPATAPNPEITRIEGKAKPGETIKIQGDVNGDGTTNKDDDGILLFRYSIRRLQTNLLIPTVLAQEGGTAQATCTDGECLWTVPSDVEPGQQICLKAVEGEKEVCVTVEGDGGVLEWIQDRYNGLQDALPILPDAEPTPEPEVPPLEEAPEETPPPVPQGEGFFGQIFDNIGKFVEDIIPGDQDFFVREEVPQAQPTLCGRGVSGGDSWCNEGLEGQQYLCNPDPQNPDPRNQSGDEYYDGCFDNPDFTPLPEEPGEDFVPQQPEQAEGEQYTDCGAEQVPNPGYDYCNDPFYGGFNDETFACDLYNPYGPRGDGYGDGCYDR